MMDLGAAVYSIVCLVLCVCVFIAKKTPSERRCDEVDIRTIICILITMLVFIALTEPAARK